MDKRYERIDNLRAIAILMVVFGHSIILYSTNWTLYSSELWADSAICHFFDLVKRWIDLIQMPLFFALSGYLFNEKKDIKALIISKAKRLLIPYICMAAFWMIPVKIAVGYAPYAGKTYLEILFNFLVFKEQEGHLWFLPSLFLCFVIGHFWNAYCAGRLLEKKRQALAVMGTLVFCGALMLVNRILHFLRFYDLEQWFFFFEVGYFLKHLSFEQKMKNYKVVMLIASVLLSCGAVFYPSPWKAICSVFLVLTFFLITPDHLNAVSGLLSRESFGIYLFHSPLIYITFAFFREENPFLVIFLNLVVFGTLSLLLSILIKKSRVKWIVGQ